MLLAVMKADFLCHPDVSLGLAIVTQHQHGGSELNVNYSSSLYGGHLVLFSDLLFFVIIDVVIRMSCVRYHRLLK